MNTTIPSTPPSKPKWGRLGTVVRRTSTKFTKSNKSGSDGDSDAGSLRQTPSVEFIQTTLLPNSSPSLPPTPPNKSKFGRIGRAVRRASTKLTVSRHGTSSTERESDSLSLKQTSSYETLPSTTPSLSVPPPAIEATIPSPIAESPAREAEAVQREIIGPSPLIQIAHAQQEVEEPPSPAGKVPPSPAAPAPHLVSEHQTLPIVEQVSSPLVDSSASTVEATVPAAHEPDTSLIIVPSPGNVVESPAADRPKVDTTTLSQVAESISTHADEESLVIVDSSVVDIGAYVTEFNELIQQAVFPGALPLTPNPLFDSSPSSDEAEPDIEAGQQARLPTADDVLTPSEAMVAASISSEKPVTRMGMQASVPEASQHIIVPVVDNHTAAIASEQATVEKQLERPLGPSQSLSAPASAPSTGTGISDAHFPVASNSDFNVPTSEKSEKSVAGDHFSLSSTSIISQPPPAYTVDHFPSPTPTSHLIGDPEKAGAASRPPKKDQPPPKSVLKRPTSTISPTNNAFEDFRFKTFVAVVGAVASIVATAMLFLRR